MKARSLCHLCPQAASSACIRCCRTLCNVHTPDEEQRCEECEGSFALRLFVAICLPLAALAAAALYGALSEHDPFGGLPGIGVFALTLLLVSFVPAAIHSWMRTRFLRKRRSILPTAKVESI